MISVLRCCTNPLLGLLFSYHCGEEKLGCPNSVQTLAEHRLCRSRSPLCRETHNMWRPHAHTLAHLNTYVPTDFSLYFSTHNNKATTHRKSPRDRGEEIRNTLSASPMKTFATLEQKNLSGRIGSKRKTHPFVLKTWYLSKCNLPVPAPDGTLCFLSGRSDEQKVLRAQSPLPHPPTLNLLLPFLLHIFLHFLFAINQNKQRKQTPKTIVKKWVL